MGVKVGVHGPRARIWTQPATRRPLVAGRPVSQERPVVRCPPDIRWFCSMMGVPDVRKRRTSADFGSGAGAPVVRSGPDVRSFASGAGALVVRSGPDVYSLGFG